MKLTYEQKIQIAKEALEESCLCVARKWVIDPWTVRKIKALYLENPMLLKHGKNRKYSFEFKAKIVNEIEKGEMPIDTIAIKFGITSKHVVFAKYLLEIAQKPKIFSLTRNRILSNPKPKRRNQSKPPPPMDLE